MPINAETLRQRRAFQRVRMAQKAYSRKLLTLARRIADIARLYPNDAQRVSDLLRQYSADIRPWAEATAASMLADVSRRDMKAWRKIADVMGEEMRAEIRHAPTGTVMRRLMDEQVTLITSLPLDAAKRVHHAVQEGLATGQRADLVAKAIASTGEVSKSRAMLIARTETGRAAGALTRARAEFVGSPGYVWRTAEDSDVRERHRHLNGKTFRWDNPPVSGEHGERSHPGEIYNCRCYAEVILP